MAADYWMSSHFKRWLFTREQLTELRTAIYERKRFDTEKELHLIAAYIKVIQTVGKHLQYQQMVIATAVTFLKRFYLKASVLENDLRIVGHTVLYLAAKVEEMGQIRTDNIIKTWERVKPGPKVRPSDIYACEMTVLEKLDFDLVIFHPYQDLERFVNDWGHDATNVLQVAWGILNDAQRYDSTLLYPPCILCFAAIYLASIHLKHDIKPWFDDLNVNVEKVRQCAASMLESSEKDDARQVIEASIWDEYALYWKSIGASSSLTRS